MLSSLKYMFIQSLCIASGWSFPFTRKYLEDVLRRILEGLMTSPGRRLDEVLRKVRRNVHLRPI